MPATPLIEVDEFDRNRSARNQPGYGECSLASAGSEPAAAFTPGPWSMDQGDHTHRYVHVTDADDRTIFYKYGAGSAREADQDEANARLVAAAPELLAALKRLLPTNIDLTNDLVPDDLVLPCDVTLGELRAAAAAIAKALSAPPASPAERPALPGDDQ